MNARMLAGTRRHGDALGRWLKLAMALALVATIAGCPPPTPRPPGNDGTARWAFGIAQPLITQFAADAEVRQILAGPVNLDGRLPANSGSWSFVTWSPSRAMINQVTVSFDGTTSSSQRAEAAPGPGIQRPLPLNWADSSVVFAATNGKRNAGATVANLAVLNVASYSPAPNQAVWGINFDASPNQLVAVTGAYIGPQ